MTDIDFEQRKKLVWKRVQKEIGFVAPTKLKEQINRLAGPVRDLEDLEAYVGTVESYLSVAKTAATYECLPTPKISGTQKRYIRPLQRRSYLVEFVINQHLTTKKPKNSTRKRFNWRQICKEWNITHSFYTMTPSILKTTYFRAAADSEVQKTILIKQAKLLQQSLEKALAEGWIDQIAINNLRILLQMPKNNMPSSFKAKYHDFVEKMADALESIYRD